MRIRLIRKLKKAGGLLLKIPGLFNSLGTDTNGFDLNMSGKGVDGFNKTIRFELIACSGDGPYIPCMPAIIIAKKLANNEIYQIGAQACMGFITLNEYLDALAGFDIETNYS